MPKFFFRQVLTLMILLSGLFPALAEPQEIYTFSNQVQQQRFEKITQELRCLVCQNESLADSTAGLATDLRNEVYQQVQKGADETAIKHYLVARYGQFILFKPELNTLTVWLWVFPFVLLVLAFIVVGIFSIRRRKIPEKIQFSAEEKQRLDRLLR